MALAKKVSQTEHNTILLVVVDEPGEEVLQRVAAVAQSMSADLQIYCPIVIPPVPLSGMATEMPPLVDDREITTARSRRLAARTLRALRGLDIRAHAQAGVCTSVNEGIFDATARLRPVLLVIPKTDAAGLLERPYVPDYEEIARKSDISTWVASRGPVASDSIVGLLAPGSAAAADNEKVAAETARLARSLNAQAHLLCCGSNREALARAEAAIAQQITKVSEHEESEKVMQIYELASRYQIPNTRIHIDNGSESDVIERIIEPLGVGLVVACARTRTIFGGLFTREKIPDLADASCDLLVLGDDDVPHS